MKNKLFILLLTFLICSFYFRSSAQVDYTHIVGSSVTGITTATTTIIKSTNGVLRKIIVGTPVIAATIKVYNVAGAGCTGTPANLLGSLLMPASLTNPPSYDYNMAMTNGICIITSGATDVTVVWD